MPVTPASRLLWEISTPLGIPVEPLVYMMTARSDGCGRVRPRATEQTQGDRKRNITQCTVSVCTDVATTEDDDVATTEDDDVATTEDDDVATTEDDDVATTEDDDECMNAVFILWNVSGEGDWNYTKNILFFNCSFFCKDCR